MNINPKELQKFHDLWAPMIAALPAVINAAERSAELENHVVILEGRRDAAVADTENRLAGAEAAMAAHREQVKDIQAKKKEADRMVKLHIKACEDRIKDAEAQANADIEVHHARVAEIMSAASKLEQELAARLVDADAQVAARLQSANEALAAIEAKRAATEKALDSLRARLG